MSDDTKAKDLLRGGMRAREPIGSRMLDRVGRRRKQGPGSERRSKLFARMGLADPYDPDAKERPLQIGSVGLKLDKKRQPAPHARVKEPRKPKGRPGGKASAGERPQWNPKGIPKAKPKPKPRPKQAPPKPSNVPASRVPRRPGTKPPPAQALPTAPPEVAEGEPPRLGLPPKAQKPKGRFRMRRTSTSGPKVRKVEKAQPAPVVETSTPEATQPPPPPKKPVERSAPRGDVGLDDLFGMGGGEGRMRMGRRKKGE